MKPWSLVALSLVSAACSVPWLLIHSPELGFLLQCGFALVCHQRGVRSFVLFGGSVAVCARCLGIYFGAALGSMLRVSRQVARQFLIAAVVVSALDWLAELKGVHGNRMATRFVLGLALGAAGAMLVRASQIDKTTALARRTTLPGGQGAGASCRGRYPLKADIDAAGKMYSATHG